MHAQSLENPSITITLPIYARSEANLRQHWAKKSKRASEQRFVTAAFLRQVDHVIKEICDSGLRIEIEICRIRPKGRRALDDDNLRSSAKHVRDGVADVLGIDDGSERLVWTYKQEVGREYAVGIKIGLVKS